MAIAPAVTVVDVARLAGVSTATAARALGGYGAVKPSTHSRVQTAAEKLGYRANALARSMITGRTLTIGVIIADIDNPFFARVTRGITDVAKSHGLEVILANTDEDVTSEISAVQVLVQKRIDGLIVAPASRFHGEHLRGALEGGSSVVLIDRQVDGLKADSVTLRNSSGARDAVSRLVDLGHRRIGYVSGALKVESSIGPGGITTGEQRISGYRRALRDAGIPFDPSLIRTGGPRRQDAATQTSTLLDLVDRPTAIIAADSLISLGVIEELHRRGVQIPYEVSVVGFDDAEWTTVIQPSFSVIAQPAYDLGARAGELLIERIEGYDGPTRATKLRSTYIERGSTAFAASDFSLPLGEGQ